MSLQLGRRSFVSSLGAAGMGVLSAGKSRAAGNAARISKVDGEAIVAIKSGLGSSDIYADLGVVPLININGIVTVIGGSLMKPEVMECIRQGNEHFTRIDELEEAAGRRLAKLCKAPAGMTGLITSGAAAAILVSYSAMMTEDWESRLSAIPDLTGFPKTEIIIQKSHRNAFDHQIRQTGAKLVVVEGRDELIAAINPRTVAIHFTNIQSNAAGSVSGPDTVAIAKQRGVYTFCDASADVPPKARLWEYPAVGFDATTFSGGKDICGPQATGVVIGREDLMAWALLNMSPQENRIGRPCKVGKESIFGLLKAVELFVNQDEEAVLRAYDAKAQVTTDALARFGVTALPRQYDPTALGNVTPKYSWQWDGTKLPITGAQVVEQLAATRPLSIGAPGTSGSGSLGRRGRPDASAAPAPARAANPNANSGGVRGNAYSFGYTVWQVKDGEEKIIADRLAEIFKGASAKKS